MNGTSRVTLPWPLLIAGVIKGAGVTPQQREILWTRFNGLLESLAPDGRSFAASMGRAASRPWSETGRPASRATRAKRKPAR